MYQSINNKFKIMKIILIILAVIICIYSLYSLLYVVFILLPEGMQSDIRKGVSSILLSKVIDILPKGEFKQAFCQFIVNNEHKLNQ